MGKASRAKKEYRQAMAHKPGWHQEGSRQAKQRHRDEIKSHNEAMDSEQIERFKSSSDQVAVMIDGKLYSGKKELAAVYASLTQQVIESDSPEMFEKYLGLEALFETSIWDVKIEVIDLDGGGVKKYFDPLKAAFVMDQEKCFEWFLDHARKSKVGHKVVSDLFAEIIPLVDQLDATEPVSIRCRSAKLLIRNLCEFFFDHAGRQALEPLQRLTGFSTTLANELHILIGKDKARVEREEIEKSLTKQADVDDCEPNPDAIRMADEVVGTAQEASKSERSVRGMSRSL